ncbi:MAG: type IV conjugative transfer system protein TraL [Candidatus Paracaedibacteraceae bacterium]|nr:type IV conjugative transfer system protein TraL [Candidatus Paracaedibacteraceae bacterium]
MNIKEHRIYKYMSEPIRIAGLTLDELFILIGSIFLFIVLETLFYKLFFLMMGTVGVFVLKRIKKIAIGFSLLSFLHWKYGVRLGLPKQFPESWKRFWLP